jgi:Predicted metal-dependent hydrolase with the TIM-barrel fold
MFAPDTRVALATLILISAGAIGCARPPQLAADLVVTHARVWTGNPAQPSAAAVAVIGDRIVDVGSDDEIDRWRDARTTVVDAEERRIVPGFNDAHVRMFDGGSDLEDVDLRDAGTATEFARRINERAKAKPGEWILGGHWDERHWTPARFPRVRRSTT